jgi:hypothetical protein
MVFASTDSNTSEHFVGVQEVLEWCPKNNPLRAVLGVLKAAQNPVPLGVYDCVLTEADEIYVKLTRD